MPSPARRHPTRSSWPLAALGLAVLVGCGGSSGGTSETPPPPPDALPGSPPEVEEALLTAEDLGEEWVDIGPVPLEDRGFDECPQSAAVTGEEDAAARLGEVQSTYLQGEPPAPSFGVSVSLWESADTARARMSSIASIPEGCGTFAQQLPDGDTATITVVPRQAPALGDEAIALEHRADLQRGQDATLDVVLVRLGNALVLTESQRVEGEPEVSLDLARLDELTALAVEKARATLHATP